MYILFSSEYQIKCNILKIAGNTRKIAIGNISGALPVCQPLCDESNIR